MDGRGLSRDLFMAFATFTWSVMSPSDFVKFRLVEFDEDAIPVSTLNRGGSWVVYVAAIDSQDVAIASTTVAIEEGAGRPTDREAFAAARFAAASITHYVREQGFDVDEIPRIMRRPLPAEYTA